MIYIYLILVAMVMIDAIADAKHDNTGHREHVLEAIEVGLIFLLLFALVYYPVGVLILLVVYTLLRIAIFNWTYNYFRGLPRNYAGKSDIIFDKWIRKIPNWLMFTIRLLCIFFSIALMF